MKATVLRRGWEPYLHSPSLNVTSSLDVVSPYSLCPSLVLRVMA